MIRSIGFLLWLVRSVSFKLERFRTGNSDSRQEVLQSFARFLFQATKSRTFEALPVLFLDACQATSAGDTVAKPELGMRKSCLLLERRLTECHGLKLMWACNCLA